MLQAIPRTPLYERLQREQRLVEQDPNCNFVPKQMSREELQRGYWELVRRLYTPEAFLERYFRVFQFPEYLRRRAAICRKAGEGKTLPTLGYGLALMWSLGVALWRAGAVTSVGRVYLSYFCSRYLKYRRDIVGFAYEDTQVLDEIGRVHERYGYLLDPHSAIAWLALQDRLAGDSNAYGVFLATAHPAKFGEVVEPATGQRIELPRALADALSRPRHSVSMPADYAALEEFLRAEPVPKARIPAPEM